MTREEGMNHLRGGRINCIRDKDEDEELRVLCWWSLKMLEDLKWLMENYPIRLDHYDTEHGNIAFVLGVESVREYVLDVLNGEISVDIEALKAEISTSTEGKVD